MLMLYSTIYYVGSAIKDIVAFKVDWMKILCLVFILLSAGIVFVACKHVII